MDTALSKSPVLAELRHQKSTSMAEGAEISRRANPELSIETRPFIHKSEEQGNEYELLLSQELRPSDFRTRERLSQLIRDSADTEHKQRIHSFSQNLTLAFAKVWALQERSRYLITLERQSQKLLSLSLNANRNGLLPLSSRDLLIAETFRAKTERSGIEADIQGAIAALSHLVGKKFKEELFKEPSISELPETIPPLEKIARLDLARRRYRLAKERRNLVEIDSFPKLSPRLGFERTSDGDERILLGITFPLPFFKQNEAEILIADAEQELRLEEKNHLETAVFEQHLQLLLSSTRSLFKQAKSYRSEVLPALEKAFEANQREFIAGQGTQQQLWQILREMSEIQERSLQAWLKALTQKAELSIIIGNDI